MQLVYSSTIPCVNGDILAVCDSGTDGYTGEVSGTSASDLLGATESVAVNIAMLAVFIVFFRFASLLALRFVPHNSGRT